MEKEKVTINLDEMDSLEVNNDAARVIVNETPGETLKEKTTN